jgi:hypothetical protein
MKYNCSLATFGPCFCGSIPFQLSLSTCVQQNCTFDNQVRELTTSFPISITKLTTQGAADVGNELCAGTPKPSRSAEIQRDTIILAAVTYPIVALRCYQRWSIAHQTWWDDIAALVATVSGQRDPSNRPEKSLTTLANI